MDTKKKKKTTYRGVVTPPIKDAFLRGAALGRAITPQKRGSLKKEPVMQTEAIMSKSTASVKPSKPRYELEGRKILNNPLRKKLLSRKDQLPKRRLKHKGGMKNK